MTFHGRCKTISGEVRTSPHLSSKSGHAGNLGSLNFVAKKLCNICSIIFRINAFMVVKLLLQLCRHSYSAIIQRLSEIIAGQGGTTAPLPLAAQ
jgi:hypothetical protein